MAKVRRSTESADALALGGRADPNAHPPGRNEIGGSTLGWYYPGFAHGRSTDATARLNAQSASVTRLNAKALNVTRDRVDPNALDVVSRLREAGFQALLVGGCVRDLLLGAAPKDFDVATDATPEQVRRLFRRSRMVGRRFKIAHVHYGREFVEVSTFRKLLAADEDGDHTAHPTGLILRDNAYGTLDEDAFRRDFTVNALYYDPHDNEILDFVGGYKDIERHRLRCIGDPLERLREDPVRLLRAIRFQAKLGFDLDAGITRDENLTAERLTAIPPARLFEEFTKLFLTGHAANAWEIVRASPVRGVLFPTVPPDNPLIRMAMDNTDRRIAEDKPVTPGFLIAVMLWDDYRSRIDELLASTGAKHKPMEAALVAAHEAIAAQRLTISIPRRFSSFVHDTWHLQERLETRRPKLVLRTLQHPRFRAAYDFLLLRAAAGTADRDLARWWEAIQEVDSERRDDMLTALRADDPGNKRRRRGRRRTRRRQDA